MGWTGHDARSYACYIRVGFSCWLELDQTADCTTIQAIGQCNTLIYLATSRQGLLGSSFSCVGPVNDIGSHPVLRKAWYHPGNRVILGIRVRFAASVLSNSRSHPGSAMMAKVLLLRLGTQPVTVAETRVARPRVQSVL